MRVTVKYSIGGMGELNRRYLNIGSMGALNKIYHDIARLPEGNKLCNVSFAGVRD